MLSTVDLERLIAVKRREIDKEKTRLGLAPSRSHEEKENETASETRRHVSEGKREQDAVEKEGENEDIPPNLERYIRRYLGLPVMLKAGEYSPNNPLIRAERRAGDALLGLGEYERTRNTLRRLRQQQYKEYLDQQAKKKQEDKELSDRVRRERERREKELEERERQRRTERERAGSEPRAHTNTVFTTTSNFTSKVDTGVQTVGVGVGVGVAVQTDDTYLYGRSATRAQPPAERELSPRSHRRSCGDCQQDPVSTARRLSEAARGYRPSVFDADDIQRRNETVEQEAAAKRRYYQQELKTQIQEQKRLREERKAREKMLEEAEMRRLEEQLRMLRVAQERELGRQCEVTEKMRENATDYEKNRTALQKEIDLEQQALYRIKPRTHTSHSDIPPSKLPLYHPPKQIKSQKQTFSTNIPDDSIFSPNYDVDSYLRKNLNPSKESLFHNRLLTASSELGLSSKYLNVRFPTDDRKITYNDKEVYNDIKINYSPKDKENGYNYNDAKSWHGNDNTNDKSGSNSDKRVVIEKALVHDRPKAKYDPSNRSDNDNPIPVLRHSPIVAKVPDKRDLEISDAMKVVDDKWKVPVVQNNILKSLPNEEGKNVNILTQLGSIRRQLQLEQLKLDKMLTKDDI